MNKSCIISILRAPCMKSSGFDCGRSKLKYTYINYISPQIISKANCY